MHPSQASMGASLEGALCPRHPAFDARAICSRCGSYACAQCHQLGADGLDYCVDCQARVPVLASRGARFMANLVDQFALMLPIIIGAILQAIVNDSSRGAEPDFFLMGLGFLVTLGVAGYQLYLLSQTGQSLGKRMLKIRLVRTDGSPVSVARILFVRNLVPAAVGSFCSIFNLVDALFIFNDDHRCLHDMIADTKVVDASLE